MPSLHFSWSLQILNRLDCFKLWKCKIHFPWANLLLTRCVSSIDIQNRGFSLHLGNIRGEDFLLFGQRPAHLADGGEMGNVETTTKTRKRRRNDVFSVPFLRVLFSL